MPEMTKEQLLDMIDDLRHKLDKSEARADTFERKLAAAEQKNAKLVTERNEGIVEREIVRPALAMGLLPDAIPDIVGAATRAGWKTNEFAELELRDPKTGDIAIDVTPTSWVQSQATGPRQKYFQGGQQTGGGGGSGGGFAPERNPWGKDSWDDMGQVAAIRANPEKAKQMAAAAGSRIGALRSDHDKKPY